MHQEQTLFVLQNELIDKKVEIAVNNRLSTMHSAVTNLTEQVVNLKQEMHQEFNGFRTDMQEIRYRLKAVETVVVTQKERQVQIHNHFLDYCFKAGWTVTIALLACLFSFLGSYIHHL